MAAVSIRDLDDSVREKLRVRAARHRRSMEAEMRAILTAAVAEDDSRPGLISTLAERFSGLGGVELELPPRATSAGRLSYLNDHRRYQRHLGADAALT
jgi:antitoxin FitA